MKKYLSLLWGLPIVIVSAIATPTGISDVLAQEARSGGGAMTVRSDIQEANSQTGVITARGNVQINYPARKIQATSAQAQYFSRERRLVLSGNVYVLQEGNSMRAETMTYLVDEGRFIATPQANQQVESIYIVSDPESVNNNPVSVPPAPSLNRQP
ncbi:MAG: ostA-like family protein [Hydrococcus sp. Prado102]|jgi:lipopolysaccharide export system protein LptA|nr:ostA-like family protein [Hydrococcus sp. Prado102]